MILGLAVLQLVLFFFVVPETLWVEDDAPFISTEYYAASSKVKGGHEHVETASPTAPSLGRGHVGAFYMPWKDPIEYMRISLSPILLVSTPQLFNKPLFPLSSPATVTPRSALASPLLGT